MRGSAGRRCQGEGTGCREANRPARFGAARVSACRAESRWAGDVAGAARPRSETREAPVCMTLTRRVPGRSRWAALTHK
jgi:hypothetical protein